MSTKKSVAKKLKWVATPDVTDSDKAVTAMRPAKEPVKKVYCGDCRYLQSNSFYAMGIHVPLPCSCNSPKNIGDSWQNPNSIHLFDPSEKNEKNDCDWFEKKPAEAEPPQVEKKSWIKRLSSRIWVKP